MVRSAGGFLYYRRDRSRLYLTARLSYQCQTILSDTGKTDDAINIEARFAAIEERLQLTDELLKKLLDTE